MRAPGRLPSLGVALLLSGGGALAGGCPTSLDPLPAEPAPPVDAADTRIFPSPDTDHLSLRFEGLLGVEQLGEGELQATARVRGQPLDLSGDADHLAIWAAYQDQSVGAVRVEDGRAVRVSAVGGGLLVDSLRRMLVYRAEIDVPLEVLREASGGGGPVPLADSAIYELEIAPDPESLRVTRRCLIAVGDGGGEGRLLTRGAGVDEPKDGDTVALTASVPLTTAPEALAAATAGQPCVCWDAAGREQPCPEPESPGPEIDPCEGIEPPTCDPRVEACGELAAFTPVRGPGWLNTPLADETPDDLYRGYLRRDLQRVIRYAAQTVACVSRDWPGGNSAPLSLADMSEADGSVPGTSREHPTHPAGSHTGGDDIDVGYYQTAFFPDNDVRPVCNHLVGGVEVWHCVAPPDRLDVRRTALFTALVAEQEIVRCIGVDGTIGPLLRGAQRELFDQGLITRAQLEADKLCYETEDTGRGWYRSHHDHMHISAY